MRVRLWSTRHHVRSKVLGYHAKTDRKLVTEAVKKNVFFQALIITVLLWISYFHCEVLYLLLLLLLLILLFVIFTTFWQLLFQEIRKEASPTLPSNWPTELSAGPRPWYLTENDAKKILVSKCSNGSQDYSSITAGTKVLDCHHKISQIFKTIQIIKIHREKKLTCLRNRLVDWCQKLIEIPPTPTPLINKEITVEHTRRNLSEKYIQVHSSP